MSTEYDNEMNSGEQNPTSDAPTGAVPSDSTTEGYYHYIRPTDPSQTANGTQATADAQNFTTQQNPAGNTYQSNPAANTATESTGTDGYGGYGYRRPEQQNYGGYRQSYNTYQPGNGYQQNNGYQQSSGNTGYQQSSGNTGYQQSSGNTGYQQSSGFSGQYSAAQYASGQGSGNDSKPPRKKSGKLAKVIALALACVIVGGAAGGGIAAAAMHHSSKADDTKEQMAATSTQIESSTTEIGGNADTGTGSAAEDTTDEKGDAFQQTTISINSNAETNDLVPQDVYENYVNAVVAICNQTTATNVFGQTSNATAYGSGMIISSDGYILTNNHVVEDAQSLTVTMTDGNTYDATIIGADSVNDVALIKIDATDLPTVSIGDSDQIAVGQQVCAIGNPLGELTNTLTVGYVSALDREIYESESGTSINMFQTDCAINSGNSGGPIFDMSGNVIGITTAKYSSSSLTSSASIEGIGFCIPINDAMDIVNDFLTYGYVRGRPSIGITCQNISSTVTQYYNLPVGVYVVSVTAGSGAEAAGLQEGDIITSINGTAVETVSALKSELKNYEPGDSVELEIYRSGETVDVTVVLDESVTTASSSESSDASGSSDGQQSQGEQSQGDQSQQSNPYSGYSFPFGN